MGRFTILVLLLINSLSLLAQPLAIGDWRYHAAYGNVKSVAVAQAENMVFAASNNAVFSYDIETGEIQRYNKVSGMSDVNIQRIDYAEQAKTLIISYNNGNIDLLRDGFFINVSALERSPIANSKIVNNVLMQDSLAFMSCSFGVMVLDVMNEQVLATYVIGDQGSQVEVYDFEIFDGFYWAATSNGVKKADPNASNLQNFQFWETVNIPEINGQIVEEIEKWNGSLVIHTNSEIYKGDGSSWSLFHTRADASYRYLDGTENDLVFYENVVGTSAKKRFIFFDENEDSTHIEDSYISFPSALSLRNNGEIWAGDRGFGLLHFESVDRPAERISPAGPYSEKVFDMDAGNNKLWVATGAYNAALNYQYNRDGALYKINDYWGVFNEYIISEFNGFLDVVSVKMHPDQSREDVYFGSFYAGLIHYDGENFKLYNSDNSVLRTRTGDSERTVITELNFDNSENLWMTSYDTEYPITIWTAEDQWIQLKPNVVVAENDLRDFVFDDAGQVWFLISRSTDQGLLVLNHGNTLSDPSDDVYRILRTGEGLGNLPSNKTTSIAIDENGEIWVGTDQGLTVFYCPTSALTSSGCDAQQIYLEQDGLGAYLLDEQSINAITVDEGNRKWIGTSNGVWLFSADGTEELEYFNVDNSPLPSNNILSIAIDDATGEVYIGTDLGIISFKGESTKGEETHSDVFVYPNPVRHDYEGPIAVKGLVDDAIVKFTDAAGQLIYETRAYGGQAIWNGRNPNGQRAKSGVYLVFSSNEDGSEKYVAKFVLIK